MYTQYTVYNQCIISNCGIWVLLFFAPGEVGYENILLSVLDDTSDEISMCNLKIIF